MFTLYKDYISILLLYVYYSIYLYTCIQVYYYILYIVYDIHTLCSPRPGTDVIEVYRGVLPRQPLLSYIVIHPLRNTYYVMRRAHVILVYSPTFLRCTVHMRAHDTRYLITRYLHRRSYMFECDLSCIIVACVVHHRSVRRASS